MAVICKATFRGLWVLASEMETWPKLEVRAATFGTNVSNYIAVQLGELEVGTYSVTVGLSEQITELYVVDGEGGDYVR